MVTIYKNRQENGNGEIVISTDARDLREYTMDLGEAILAALEKQKGDEEFTINGILENAFPIAFKLSGYKAETVHEVKTLTSGHSNPAECDKLC